MFKDINDAIEKLLTEDGHDEALEKIANTFIEEIASDDEPARKVGREMLLAFRDSDVDVFSLALTGWTFESILKKAGIIPDNDHTFS